MSQRSRYKLFLSSFLLILCLPLMQMVLPVVAIAPLDENRKAASPPSFSDISNPEKFLNDTRVWFQDHYGFREILIRLKAQMDYSLFGFSDRIYIGKEGWLYFRSVIDKEEPAVEELTDEQLDKIVSNFVALRDKLAKRGVKLVVMTNQLKYKFYPEYLPANGAQAKNFHRFDAFRTKMQKLSGIIYIDTTPRLLELKNSMQVFYKTDFHWTQAASFDAAQTLVNKMAGKRLWQYPLETTVTDFSGGQATFMPLFHPFQEAVPVLAENRNLTNPPSAGYGPFEFVSWQPEKAGLLPPTVMFGDSFAQGLFVAGVRDYFKSFAFARIHHARFTDVLASMPEDTKFLIFQFIDVALPNFTDPDFTTKDDPA